MGETDSAVPNPDFSQLTAKALESIRSKLLDLSLRNKLINYRESAKAIRIVDELPNAIIDKIIDERRELQFLPYLGRESKVDTSKELPVQEEGEELEDKHTDQYLQTLLDADRLENRLRLMSQEAKRAIQETGANLLYLTMGFLEWHDTNSGKTCQAPLILIPVELERKRQKKRNSIAYTHVLRYNEEDMSVNFCLLRKLEEEFGLVLPNLEEDPEDIVPEAYFTRVQEAVADKRDWCVHREMLLDFFSFAKLFMFLDLDPTTWPEERSPAQNKILMDLLVGREAPQLDAEVEVYDIDSDERATGLTTVYDADSAQMSAMVDVMAGDSLVIEGPPGTGKSQTITNLIATSLGQGKTVLFLAEKMAALEVVKHRLDQADLGPFILELHSHKTNKRHLIEDLRKRIEHRRKTSPSNKQTLAKLESAKRELNQLHKLLNVPIGETGLPLVDALWNRELNLCDNRSHYPVFDQAIHWADSEISTRRQLVLELTQLLGGQAPRAANWYGLTATRYKPEMERELCADMDRLGTALERLGEAASCVQELTGTPIQNFQQLDGIKNMDRAAMLNTPGMEQYVITQIADVRKRDLLRGLSGRLKQVAEARKAASTTLSDLDGCAPDELWTLAALCERKQDEGLGHLRFSQLLELIAALEGMLDVLNELNDALSEADNLPFPTPKTPGELKKLVPLCKLIAEETPVEAELYVCDQLFTANAGDLVDKIRSDGEQLAKTHEKLAKRFDLNSPISTGELGQILDEFEAADKKIFPWMSSSYRDAGFRFDAISLKPVSGKDHRLKEARALHHHLAGAEQFLGNRDYQHGLGVMFNGLHTDWDLIERLLEWRKKLSEVVINLGVEESLRYRYSDSAKKLTKLHFAIRNYEKKLPGNVKLLGQLLGDHVDSTYHFDLGRSAPLLPIPRVETALAQLERLREITQDRLVDSASTIADFITAIGHEQSARNLVADIRAGAELYEEIIGPQYQGESSDLEWIDMHLNWVDSLVAAHVPESMVEWLCREDTSIRAQKLAVEFAKLLQYEAECQGVASSFDAYGGIDLPGFCLSAEGPLSFRDVQGKIGRCKSDLNSLLNWSDFSRACADAVELGIGQTMDAIDDGTVAPSQLARYFEFLYYHSLADAALRQSPELAGLGLEKLRALRARFSELHEISLGTHSDNIIRNLKKKRAPQGVSHGPVSQRTELGLIRREISKTKRHLPIRSLVSRAGETLQRLKPCFMMSPLSVAQFLPPDSVEFDLLIMDEASQLRPEECLGAIARARQVVVVGDPNQLPPTSFFDRVSDEPEFEEEESALDNMESILDLFSQSYGCGRRLLWHYRSQHEDLIRFSNQHFYGNTLTLFPSPRPMLDGYGVSLVEVNGVYQKGENRREADEIAKAVLEHVQARPDVTLGVGTFNSAQRELVLHCIDEALARTPDALAAFEHACRQSESFFVKNLENIQGDERDAIFISFTYGPDAEDKFFQRFGPINGREGWRRLNVMFTRARKEVRVFASFGPERIRLDRNTSRGVEMLRRYLEYARICRQARIESPDGNGAITPFQKAIARVVQELGYSYTGAVGFGNCLIDLAVKDPQESGRYCLGIIGDSSIATGSCNDRERLRYCTLERLGWNIHVINSIDWYRRREREVQRLRRALEGSRA